MSELNEKMRFNLKKASVLLLESPTNELDISAQILGALGVKAPRRCKSAEDAVKLAKAITFDLILCDGGLPQGGAYDFVSSLRSSDLEPNRYCPVILVAGYTPMSLIGQARDCGANFVVTKPLSPRVLLERIIWMSLENRSFVELDSYVGPDRRFHQLEDVAAKYGRRRGDKPVGGDGTASAVDESQATEADT